MNEKLRQLSDWEKWATAGYPRTQANEREALLKRIASIMEAGVTVNLDDVSAMYALLMDCKKELEK